jgi:DNA mismatch repair protein MutL
VIERPASVVKELIENALDAGAKKISVCVSSDVVGSIRVSDDGDGMAQDDARRAFERHATSKLSCEADLHTLTTMGFRGEALPSIAAVSRVRLTTRTAGEEEGTELLLSGGVFEKSGTVGIPVGSTFEVSDLFFNTPARRKFLKSSQTEGGHIHETLLQSALVFPSIHFRLVYGQREMLDTPPVSTLADRAFQLFDRSPIDDAIAIDDSAGGMRVQALMSRPPLHRNYRKQQYLFVNNRPIKNATLAHAVYDAYDRLLMKGEHPFYVLALSIDPGLVDVNVHPGKKEVRFQSADVVHRTVSGILRRALSVTQQGSAQAPSPAVSMEARPAANDWIGWPTSGRGEALSHRSEEEGTGQSLPLPAMSIGRRGEMTQSPLMSWHTAPVIRPLGQVYETFLLAEVDGEMLLIDQHTAHERLLYEQLLAHRKNATREIQPFLIPPQIDLSPQQMAVICEHLPLFAELGWGVEAFGERTIIVREAPASLASIDVTALFLELSEEMESAPRVSSLIDREQALVASMACHAAVRAGQRLSPEEIRSLLADYFGRQTPHTCPHGRPVFIRYSADELEKLFRRK